MVEKYRTQIYTAFGKEISRMTVDSSLYDERHIVRDDETYKTFCENVKKYMLYARTKIYPPDMCRFGSECQFLSSKSQCNKCDEIFENIHKCYSCPSCGSLDCTCIVIRDRKTAIFNIFIPTIHKPYTCRCGVCSPYGTDVCLSNGSINIKLCCQKYLDKANWSRV
jgi:hypothetical protein